MVADRYNLLHMITSTGDELFGLS